MCSECSYPFKSYFYSNIPQFVGTKIISLPFQVYKHTSSMIGVKLMNNTLLYIYLIIVEVNKLAIKTLGSGKIKDIKELLKTSFIVRQGKGELFPSRPFKLCSFK